MWFRNCCRFNQVYMILRHILHVDFVASRSRMKSDFDAVLHLGDLANSLAQVGILHVNAMSMTFRKKFQTFEKYGDLRGIRTDRPLDDIGRHLLEDLED